MRDKVSEIIENALDNDSPDFSEMSENEIETRKDLINSLEQHMTYATGRIESYSQKYTDALMEISYQMDQEYKDGYYPTRTGDTRPSESQVKPLEIPMSDTQQAAAMFESLNKR